MAELVSALSYALDQVEGQPPGHSVKSCMIGLRLGDGLGLSGRQMRDLYFSLLLKDAGCSSNASRMCQIVAGDDIIAKRDVKLTDWTKAGLESLRYAWTHVAIEEPWHKRIARIANIAFHRVPQQREMVQIRCERGASIAREMGFTEATAEAIQCLDEHWNGKGYPDGLAGDEIPVLARILNLSQTLELYFREQGPDAAIRIAKERSRSWFDPRLVKLAASLAKRGTLFADLDDEAAVRARLLEREPVEDAHPLTEDRIDAICVAFASVVDAKSPFTFRHSLGVTSAATAIAERMGFTGESIPFVRRAALLHDIGKLSVPNTILEKPSKLDDAEWQTVKRHPYHTREILLRIPGFEQLAEVAASHHEKLDGTGYWRGLTAAELSMPARLLVVADIYDALAAARPYRGALPTEQVFEIIGKETPHKLDGDCVQALRESVYGGDLETIDSMRALHFAIQASRYKVPVPETELV